MCRATSVGRSYERILLEGRKMGFRGRTDGYNVELEERNDLLLYVEEG